MRISFDIDDTLVCDPSVPVEQFVPWWLRWRYREGIRQGSRDLMRQLLARRHELWVYTTSYRERRYLKGWFRSFGISLSGVINQYQHEREIGRQGPSKNPGRYGIDLHIDDSVGVAIEGLTHGFRVLVISPNDLDWTERVLAAASGSM